MFYIHPVGERGYTFYFRNNIPHAGAENLTDRQNVKLHSFIMIDNWGLPQNDGMTTKIVNWDGVPKVKWDVKDFVL